MFKCSFHSFASISGCGFSWHFVIASNVDVYDDDALAFPTGFHRTGAGQGRAE